MKKRFLIAGALLSLTLMAGCSNVNVSKDGNSLEIGKTQKNNPQKISKKVKKPNKKAEDQELKFDAHKKAKLDKEVESYGKSKKISFEKYDNKHSMKISGGRIYPETFKKDTFIFNDKKISIGWAPQGGDKYAYKVLAIYNHDFDQKGSHQTFLFCLHDKKPIVLIDSTKSGNKIILTESKDGTLNEHFKDIMNGTQY